MWVFVCLGVGPRGVHTNTSSWKRTRSGGKKICGGHYIDVLAILVFKDNLETGAWWQWKIFAERHYDGFYPV